MSIRIAKTTRKDRKFYQGYICAIASMVAGHGANTPEKEALRAIGIDPEHTDENDARHLVEAAPQLGIKGELLERLKKKAKVEG